MAAQGTALIQPALVVSRADEHDGLAGTDVFGIAEEEGIVVITAQRFHLAGKRFKVFPR